MESIHKFENTVGEWLKPFPHLPNNWRNWIAKNIWWIVLVGVILSIIGTLMLVGVIFAAMATVGTVVSVYGAYGVSMPQVYTGWWYLASVISMIFLILTIIINAMAVTPLKNMKSKGWDLLFLTFVVGVISSIVNIILNLGSLTVVTNIISSVIAFVIGAYLLFEIRSHFKPAAAKK